MAVDWIENNKSKIIEVSDKIWEFAELGLVEHKSAALLTNEMEKNGFKLECGVADMPTAFVATWGSGKPVIGVLSEYDALMGVSQKVSTKKEPLKEGTPGHGCGHNLFGASGMATALAVKSVMEKAGIKGIIKLFGTPAEESASGKVWMVRDGIFNGVDAVISMHPGQFNTVSMGSNLANNSIKFHFYGTSAHAARPEEGRSALDAVELMSVGVNFLREHVVQEARIHYVIEEGGGQPNVVPPYARVWYLIRAPERDQVDSIYKRILNIAKGAELMTETKLEVEFVKAVYNKIPTKTIGEVAISNMREIEFPEYTEEEMRFAEEISKTIPEEKKRDALRKSKRPAWEKLMDVLLDRSIPDPWDEGEVGQYSADTSDVTWQAPTLGITTTCCVLGTPGHSWQSTAQYGMGIGHKGLIFASNTLATTAIDLLTKPELIEKAWAELKERLQGHVYKTPLPQDAKVPKDIWSKKNP